MNRNQQALVAIHDHLWRYGQPGTSRALSRAYEVALAVDEQTAAREVIGRFLDAGLVPAGLEPVRDLMGVDG